MNKGIRCSNGSWIIFLNSGDKFFNNNILHNINKKKLDNYEIVFGNTAISKNTFKYHVKSKNFKKILILCHLSSISIYKKKII